MSDVKPFILGIDGGGSKTEALLMDLNTKRQTSFFSGGINSIIDGVDASREQLRLLIEQIDNRLVQENGEILSICIGSASTINEAVENWPLLQLRKAFQHAKIKEVIDSRIALEGALNGKPGAVIIAGTGSIGYSMGSGQSIIRCGGWGPVFGDEGSGYWIGCEALRSVAMEMDGRGEPTRLTERLRDHLPFHNGIELIDRVYGRMDRKEIASLAAVVGSCASDQDPVALRILDQAGKHLARLLLTLIQQTNWDSTPVLSYAGGVFRMGDLILLPLKEHLGEWAAMLKEPCHSPSYGALMLAMEEIAP